GGRPVEGADHRLVEGVEHDGRRRLEVEAADPASAPTAADALPAGLVLQVEAGTETLPGAGEDEDADVAVAVGRPERPRERVEHRTADGVEALGPVEGD